MKTRQKQVLAIALAAAIAGQTAVMAAGIGTKDDPKITTTHSTETKDGTTITTDRTVTTWSSRDSSGLGTLYQNTEVKADISSLQGALLATCGYTEGSETTVSTLTPTLTANIVPEQQTIITSKMENTLSGDLKEDDPSSYDQKTRTVDRQRRLAVTASPYRRYVKNTDAAAALRSVVFVWTGNERKISAPRPDRFGQGSEIAPDGYPYRYTGWGADSYYGAWHTTTENGDEITEECDILHFLLTDSQNPDKDDHVAYCADVCTGAKEGWWYRLDNLEQAGYYDQTAANHIRAIALHGYWGTAAGQTGSLTKFIAMLQNVQQNGTETQKTLLAGCDFSLMSEGEAQAATQMAIWQYGHRYEAGAGVSMSASNYNGSSGWDHTVDDEAAWQRINAAYAYLITLSEGADHTTQVITQDKSVHSATLAVKDPTEGGYLCDIGFTLAVTPSADDKLTATLTSGGAVLAQLDLIAGQRDYLIKDIPLQSGQELQFDINISGVQHLDRGVYIYTSEVKNSVGSQTFVGLAEGGHAVDVGTLIDFTFEVQDAIVTDTHIWRNQWETRYDQNPPEDTTPVTPDPPKSGIENPQTGEDTAVAAALLLCVVSIMCITVTKKSR